MAKVTLYPSLAFPAWDAAEDVPLLDFESAIRRMVAALNKEERTTAVVRDAHRFKILYEEVLTQAEALTRLKVALKNAADSDGLTVEEASELLLLLRAL